MTLLDILTYQVRPLSEVWPVVLTICLVRVSGGGGVFSHQMSFPLNMELYLGDDHTIASFTYQSAVPLFRPGIAGTHTVTRSLSRCCSLFRFASWPSVAPQLPSQPTIPIPPFHSVEGRIFHMPVTTMFHLSTFPLRSPYL
jgi:hypothetical protein